MKNSIGALVNAVLIAIITLVLAIGGAPSALFIFGLSAFTFYMGVCIICSAIEDLKK